MPENNTNRNNLVQGMQGLSLNNVDRNTDTTIIFNIYEKELLKLFKKQLKI